MEETVSWRLIKHIQWESIHCGLILKSLPRSQHGLNLLSCTLRDQERLTLFHARYLKRHKSWAITSPILCYWYAYHPALQAPMTSEWEIGREYAKFGRGWIKKLKLLKKTCHIERTQEIQKILIKYAVNIRADLSIHFVGPFFWSKLIVSLFLAVIYTEHVRYTNRPSRIHLIVSFFHFAKNYMLMICLMDASLLEYTFVPLPTRDPYD